MKHGRLLDGAGGEDMAGTVGWLDWGDIKMGSGGDSPREIVDLFLPEKRWLWSHGARGHFFLHLGSHLFLSQQLHSLDTNSFQHPEFLPWLGPCESQPHEAYSGQRNNN